MAPIVRFLLPVLLAAFLAFFQTDQAAAFDEPMMAIGTGNVTGVYYAAGSAVAKMHNRKRQEYGLRLITAGPQGGDQLEGSSGHAPLLPALPAGDAVQTFRTGRVAHVAVLVPNGRAHGFRQIEGKRFHLASHTTA